MVLPPCKNSSDSILVKGHGPAIQDTLTFRNCLPAPASSDIEPSTAFHFPSGEQGGRPLQGTLPVFPISKVLTAPPTCIVVVLFRAYLTRTFEIAALGAWD